MRNRRHNRRYFQFSLRTLLVLICVVALFCSWLQRRSKQWREEAARFEGSWEAVEWNFGESAFVIEFKSGAYTWTAPSSGTATRGSYILDPLSQPTQIDLINTQQLRLPGLYKIDGDRLTIIHGQTSRPANFDDLAYPNLRMVFRKMKSRRP